MVSLNPEYKPHPITPLDSEISLICWGFTVGFGYLTSRKAWEQTIRVNKACRARSIYIWLLWADVIGIFGFGIGAWLYMMQHVKHGFPLFLIIFLSWATQVLSQLQIIVNRLSLIMPKKNRARQLRWAVFIITMVTSVMLGSIWIPAVMQIDPIYAKINNISDRIQKTIYLLLDGSLNYYFVRLINQQLVRLKLERFRPLVKFNTRIAVLTVIVDLAIIGMMSYPNPYVVMAFHPPAFLVKLNIEMSMADLILRIAKSNEFTSSITNPTGSYELNYYTSENDNHYNHNKVDSAVSRFPVVRAKDPRIGTRSQTSLAVSVDQISFAASADRTTRFENDEQPLHDARIGIGIVEITSDKGLS